jgi:hypothetical protein
MGLIATGVEAFAKAFQRGFGSETTPVTADTLSPLVATVEFVAETTDDTFRNADHESQLAANAGTDAGNQVGEIGLQLYNVTKRLIDTIIPGSMSWVRGDIILHDIDPLRKTVKDLGDKITGFVKFEDTIDAWRKTTVDPDLAKFLAFIKWFDTWPLQVLNTLHDWTQHPSDLARWITPYLAPVIVPYLGDKAQRALLELLTAELLSAISDELGPLIVAAGQILATDVPAEYA